MSKKIFFWLLAVFTALVMTFSIEANAKTRRGDKVWVSYKGKCRPAIVKKRRLNQYKVDFTRLSHRHNRWVYSSDFCSLDARPRPRPVLGSGGYHHKKYYKGQSVRVKYAGRWYDGYIKNTTGSRYYVKFSKRGWERKEWVGRDRLRGKYPPKAGSYRHFHRGQLVKAKLFGKWKHAKIKVRAGNKYYIDFVNYPAKYNRWLRSYQLRRTH